MGQYDNQGPTEEVKRLQAAATERLQEDMDKAEAAKDPVAVERRHFGAALGAARRRKKLSQSELAARLKTRQSDISKIENGKGNPGLNTLLKIAKALGVHIVVE